MVGKFFPVGDSDGFQETFYSVKILLGIVESRNDRCSDLNLLFGIVFFQFCQVAEDTLVRNAGVFLVFFWIQRLQKIVADCGEKVGKRA